MHVEEPEPKRASDGARSRAYRTAQLQMLDQALPGPARTYRLQDIVTAWQVLAGAGYRLIVINRSALAAHYDRHQHTADLVPVGRGSVSATQS